MTEAELDRAVLGKLGADGLTLDSDYHEIINCLSGCVASNKCIASVDRMLKHKKELAENQTSLDL